MSRRGENIYKRKDGRWEGRYIKGRRDDGRIHYGYVYRKTYSETKAALIVLKAQFQEVCTQQGIYSGTCCQWFQLWVKESVQQEVKLSTLASYQHKIQTYILPVIGDIPLNQLTKLQLQTLINDWKQFLAASTITVLYRIVNKCLSAAVNQQLLLINPCEGLALPKREKRKVNALTLAEQHTLEKAAGCDGQGLPTLLALHTGLRMGELAALKWQQIDFENQVIQVTHTYQRLPIANDKGRTQLVYTKAKTDSSVRVVPFSNKVKQWLLTQQKKQISQFVCSKNETPIEPRLMTYHFQHLLKKAGLENIHFHQLRHTFATRCMEAMGDVASISSLLGHASIKTTLDVYTDALLEQRRSVIAAMETNVA